MNSLPWLMLLCAISFEIAGTIFLKMSDGFANWKIGMASIFCYWLCFGFLAYVLKYIPVGVAYAIWAGMGITGAAVAGYFLFKQQVSVIQYLFIALILIGAIGLNMTTKIAH